MATNQQKIRIFAQLIVFFSTFILSSTMSYAGIYKWVDEQGNVHYGQQRPTNAASEKMNVQRYAPSDKSTYTRPGSKKGSKDTAKNSSADTTEPKKKPETKAEKKRRLAACKQARKSLQTMESVGRIRARDKDGNTTFLSQQQKEERMKQSREMLSKHCK